MALLKKPDKDENEKVLTSDQAAAKKKSAVKKVKAKADIKKAASVKQPGTSPLKRVSSYFRGVYSELKKVHWPTRREVLIYTGVVVVAVIIVSTLIWIFDFAMSYIMRLFIR